jgi:hypothetical protein
LWVALLFPMTYVIAVRAPVYGGIRHLLFIYPLLAVLAGIGCEAICRWADARRWPVLVLLVIGMIDPLRFSIVNHPNQAVYFNLLAGGARGAFRRYDMDGPGNSAKPALDWILEKGGIPPDRAIRVSGPKRNAFTRAMPHYLGEYDRFIFVGWNDPPQADFDVEVLSGNAAKLRRALARGRILHAVTADGVPIALVRAGKALRAGAAPE